MQQPQGSRHETVVSIELVSCLACGHVAEVSGQFTLPGHRGSERYLRTKCLQGHLMVGPAFALQRD